MRARETDLNARPTAINNRSVFLSASVYSELPINKETVQPTRMCFLQAHTIMSARTHDTHTDTRWIHRHTAHIENTHGSCRAAVSHDDRANKLAERIAAEHQQIIIDVAVQLLHLKKNKSVSVKKLSER